MIQKINNALVPISATLKLQSSLIFMMIELPNHFIFIFHFPSFRELTFSKFIILNVLWYKFWHVNVSKVSPVGFTRV